VTLGGLRNIPLGLRSPVMFLVNRVGLWLLKLAASPAEHDGFHLLVIRPEDLPMLRAGVDLLRATDLRVYRRARRYVKNVVCLPQLRGARYAAESATLLTGTNAGHENPAECVVYELAMAATWIALEHRGMGFLGSRFISGVQAVLRGASLRVGVFVGIRAVMLGMGDPDLESDDHEEMRRFWWQWVAKQQGTGEMSTGQARDFWKAVRRFEGVSKWRAAPSTGPRRLTLVE
jgi:hypothetical protein